MVLDCRSIAAKLKNNFNIRINSPVGTTKLVLDEIWSIDRVYLAQLVIKIIQIFLSILPGKVCQNFIIDIMIGSLEE